MATSAASPVPTLSDFERSQLWKEWIGASARMLYFAALANRFTALQNGLSGLSLFLSLSTVGAFLSNPAVASAPWIGSLISWLKILLPLGTGGMSIISLFKQYTKKSYECSELYTKWGELDLECKSLWGGMYAADAPAKLKSILQKALQISAPSIRSMPNKKRLMAKCQDQATASINSYLGV